MYEYKAVVRSIYDGDTFRADVDLGFRVWISDVPFRLNQIDTPEMSKSDPAGQVARDRVRELMPVGSEVRIVTEKDKLEKYGRMLAFVWPWGTFSESINDRLVREGFAKYYDGTGPKPV